MKVYVVLETPDAQILGVYTSHEKALESIQDQIEYGDLEHDEFEDSYSDAEGYVTLTIVENEVE